MQAYGSDRLRQDGERWILASHLDKGWTARVEKTLTTAEFPGTAILWDDRYFEVVGSEPLPPGGVRYVLEPWREQHAMRLTDRYDEPSERARAEELRKRLLREKQRTATNILAIFAGHLPARVQNELASDLGLLPPRMTIVSIIGVYAAVGAMILTAVARYMAHEGLPAPLVFAAVFLAAENTVRWSIVWMQNRPVGSIAGWMLYALYFAITRRGPSPFAVEKGFDVPITQAPPDVAMRDSLMTREAMITLLTPAEQQRVAHRFGYDYRHESTAVALIVLAGSIAGVVSSYSKGAAVAGLVAAALSAEQIVRLLAFRRGPAASVLRFLVRPFVRKFL